MVRAWFSRSHSGAREIAGLTALYGVYVERGVQRAFEAIPAAPALLGLLYVLLHFVGTTILLVWVHRRHPDRFPLVRTTFVVATGFALIGYVLYPAAPPRLAELGFSDTVTSATGLDLSSDLLGALYNPFAAVPSLHFGYALIVGAVLATIAGRRYLRLLGWAYPFAMLVIIVGTGNHFIVDAALGGVVVVAGWLVARGIVEAPSARGQQLAPTGA